MKRVSPGGIAIVLVSILALACGESDDTRPSSPRTGHVALRLVGDFESLVTPFHGAVARIGVEARPVLAAPEAVPVASLLALAPDSDGLVRGEFELPESLRSLPDAAFTLEVQQLPGQATPELLEEVSRQILARQILSGWRLERPADGRARLIYQHDREVGAHRYSLHLHALRPGPVRLESRSFDVPPGASLELGYGLTTMPGAAGFVPARFEAKLGCGGESPRPVFEEVISPGDASGWRDVAIALPAAGGSCRLVLSAVGPAGAAVRGAVWAVPRVFAPHGPPEADVNVVLISLDTLRADHLSGFGYPRPTSPRIDAELIERGTRFLDVTSTYSRTDVSHMSLFTGLYPKARPEPGRLHATTPVPLLAERLREAGFDTAAYTENALLAGAFGFWFGFDRFNERSLPAEDRGRSTFEDATVYLRAHRDRRFFLFVHTYKTHAPYTPSSAYAGLFGDPAEWEREGMGSVSPRHRELANEYDRTIREADDLVGGLLDELQALGLADRTLVVLLSDHGESFGEHGVMGHSFSGHQEVIRVPVVLRGPGVPEGLAIKTAVSLVDIVPTLLDWLALPPLETSQGISLAPGLRNQPLPDPRALYFSWLGRGAAGFRYGPLKFKHVHNRESLFDLDADPGEKHSIRRRRQQVPLADAMLADHAENSARIRASFETAGIDARAPALSPEMEESLRALGYIE